MKIVMDVADLHDLLSITNQEKVSFSATDKLKIVGEVKSSNKQVTPDIYVVSEPAANIIHPGKVLIDKAMLELLPSKGELLITDDTLTCLNRRIEYEPVYEAIEINGDYREITEISKQEFDKLIKVEYAVAKDDTRPIITGICVKGNEFIATDGFRVAIRKCSICEIEETVLPAQLIKAYKKVKSKFGNVKILKSNDEIALKTHNITLIAKSLLGDYFNFKNLIPKEFNTKVKFNTKEMLDILKNYPKLIFIDFKISEGVIEIKGSIDKSIISDKLECETNGKDLEISFKPKYVIEALKQQEKEVEIKFTTKVGPAIIVNDIETDLLLPVRKQVVKE